MEPVSIVLPVYNESLALGETISDIRKVMEDSKIPYEIIVVDDGSSDDSAEIAKKNNVEVIRHYENKGTGAARKSGILKSQYEIILMLDADKTYPAHQIPELLSYMDRCDMVVGDRGKEMGTLPWLRKPAKSIIKKIASFVTGKKIYDLNSGMRAFRKSMVLKFFKILPNTHSWVSTITIAYLSNNLTVKYIPIEYYKRTGKSTFHPIRDTFNYASLVFRTIMYFNPLKVFFPIALVITGSGIAKLLYEGPYLGRPIKESTIILITVGVITGVLGLLADLIVKMNRPV